MFQRTRYIIFLICLLSLASLACRLGEVATAVSTSEFPTLPPPVPTTENIVPISVNATEFPLTTNTIVAPVGSATMTTKVDLYVRRGPSTQYPIVTALRAGESATIVGRSPDSNWWKIACPAGYGGECWSSAREQYSSASNAQNVPIAPVPPLPPSPTATHTPTATATATFTATPTHTPSPTPTSLPTMTATSAPTSYP